MIKFQPYRRTPSASAKDEMTFNNLEELFNYLHNHLNRIIAYIGSDRPVRRSDIVIDGDHNIFVMRSKPVYIGLYKEGVIL